MESNTQKLKEWAINKIRKEYADDIALLIAVHGHSVNNDGHGECFDYFIPATERGYQLSQTFIAEGIGHDLYPRSWERTEATAALKDGPIMCLGNAEIVYCRSKEDEERFVSIRKKLDENLSNKHFTFQRSLEQLDVAMNLYSSLMFHDKMYQARMAAGYISNYLTKAIAYLNGTFLDTYEKEKIITMLQVPHNFITCNQAILQSKSVKELKNLAFKMIDEVRKFLEESKTEEVNNVENVDFSNLAYWYHELSLTFRRVRYYCEEGDNERAYMDACFLQNELEIVKVEFGLKEMDLMGYYNPEDLGEMKERSKKLEEYISSEIESHGAVIDRYDTVDEFLEKN